MTGRHRHLGPLGALLLASLALPRCACDSVPDDALEECQASQPVPGAVATDILFVIDDSGSMDEEQTLLRNALGRFIQDLDASPVANDFQIGVTTSSVSDFELRPVGEQGTLVAPGVMHASDPDLVPSFQAAVLVGVGGSGREQPFEAVRLALEKSAPGGPNEGFLRPGARLAIIFLSDEDDCSGTAALPPTIDSCPAERTASPSTLVPIGDFATYLAGPIGGEARDVVVAAIVGVAQGSLDLACVAAACSPDPPATCPTCCATAFDPGERFVQLLNAVGPSRTRLASICDASFDQALAAFADAILSKTLPLEGAPADWRMLLVRRERPGASTVGCEVVPATADAAARQAADVIYEEPQAGRPASLTFLDGGDCALVRGDRVDVQVVCAR